MVASLGYNSYHMYNENLDYDINKHIEQGVQFKKYGENYVKDNEHKLLGDSSSPAWGSIVEAMTGSDSTQVSASYLARQVSEKEVLFNQLMTTYSTLYNTYRSTMLTKAPTDTDRIAMETELKLQITNIKALAQQITDDFTVLSSKMNNLSTTNDDLNKTMEDNQIRIAGKINQLTAKGLTLGSDKYDEVSIAGQTETTGLNMTSMYYHYLVYFIIAITLISFSFNLMVNPNANVMNAVYVLGALLLVYFISRHYVL